MSELNVNTITDASGGNTASINGATPTTDNTMGRNRVINGDMRIDQRNAGASVSGNGDYAVDRFRVFENTSATYTAQRSTTAPSNYSNSLLFTVGSAASATAAEYAGIETRVEGFNVADIGFGTSACKPVTLSFVVRSSVTGTYCVALTNNANNRVYVAEYTINSANTFEAKSVTVPAITSGTWLTDNSTGLKVWFDLGSGSDRNTTASAWQTNGPYNRTTNQTDFINNAGATFYITGVQLEAGSVATSFERRSYGTELNLCYRYYFRMTQTSANLTESGFAPNTTSLRCMTKFPVTMRTNPTALEQTGTATDYRVLGAGASTTVCSSVPTFNSATNQSGQTNFTVASALTAYSSGTGAASSAITAYLGWSAEL